VGSQGMRICNARPELRVGPAVSLAQIGIRVAVVASAARHLLAIGAVCGNSARTDLCGGRPAMGVPTAKIGQELPFIEMTDTGH
jgi:hypothetical protein